MKYILLVFIFIVSHSVKSKGQGYKMSKRDSLHRFEQIQSILDDTVLFSESLKSILRSDTGFEAFGKMSIHICFSEERPKNWPSKLERYKLDTFGNVIKIDSIDTPEK